MSKRFVNKDTLASTEKYLEIAKKADLSPVTLATAWSMHFDFVASTIVGARSADQLDEVLLAQEVSLSEDILSECDEVHDQIPYPMG